MNRYVASFAMCFVAASCSKRNDSGAGSPSARSDVGVPVELTLPKENMANIPAGSYPLSDPVFASDSAGACSTETLTKVGALAKRYPWPDRPQDVAAFAIDKRPVSCADYQVCITQRSCWGKPPDVCWGNRARVTLEQAIAYCQWRGAKLPTLQQWQAAVRGPTGKVSASCDAHKSAADDDCTITNDAGVTTSASWDASEFTRTMACWPADEDERRGLRALEVAPSKLQLNMFVPFDPQSRRAVWSGFRCVRSEAEATKP